MTTSTMTKTSSPSKQMVEFDTLFLTYYQPVYRLAYQITGDQTEAEDIAQETFLKLYRQRLAHQDNIRAWLYRVATNLAYNTIRSRKRRLRRQEQVSYPLDSADPEQITCRHAEQADVRRALRELPKRQQQLLLWRHAGLTYRELALALDVAETSIGALLARAHQAFAKAYADRKRPHGGEK